MSAGPRVVTAAHRRVLVVGAAGFLLFVAGLLTLLLTTAEPVTVYSGGYGPCPRAPGCDGPPWTLGVTGRQLAGAGLVALGAVLLSGVAGWLWRDAGVRPPS